MQPEQTPAPNYDFIFNPQQPQKKGFLSGNSTQKRILIIVAIVVVLLMLSIGIISALFGSKVSNTEQLLVVAQKQTELIRISEVGIKNSRTTASKNLAVTTKFTMTSEQKPLLQALASQGVKTNAKELALGKNADTDKRLEAGRQSNTFDQVFTEVTKAQLVQYQQAVKAAFDSTTNVKIKSVLADEFKNASTLAQAK